MDPIGNPETSVRINPYTLRSNPEERRSHLHRGRNVKSREIRPTRYKQEEVRNWGESCKIFPFWDIIFEKDRL